MIELSLKGADLAKVLRNVELWVDPAFFSGKVFVHFWEEAVYFYSCDGYVAAMDRMDYGQNIGVEARFLISTEDLTAMIDMCVESKTGPLLFQLDEHGFTLPWKWEVEKETTVLKNGTEKVKETQVLKEEPTRYGQPVLEDPDWVEAFHDAIEVACDSGPYAGGDLGFRPERLQKFTRLRVDKNAPFDFRFIEPINPLAGPLAVLKAGYTFRALVNFVQRDVAKKNLSEEEQVFLWD